MKETWESLINKIKGYGFFPNRQVYDLKYGIAYSILPRLELYILLYKDKKAFSVPDNIDSNFDTAVFKWIEILEQIKFPFEYLLKPEKYSNLDSSQIAYKKEVGLRLFTEYFDSLWN